MPRNNKSRKNKRKSTRWQKQVKDEDRIMTDARPNDLVIPIMGPTGVGKSTFINKYFGGAKKAEVGYNLASCTRNLGWYTETLQSPKCYEGRRLVLVDTPGFDDTYEDDSEILRRIGVWLAASYAGGMSLAGVIYLHDISQKRMLGTTRMNLRMFESLVGKSAFPTVALVTTQWDTVKTELGLQREKELKSSFWADPLKYGAVAERLVEPTTHQKVIEGILIRHSQPTRETMDDPSMLIQEELVDRETIIPLTEAGQKLRYNLDQLLKYQAELAKNAADDEEKKKEVAEKIVAFRKQLDTLAVPMGTRIASWVRNLIHR